MADSMKNTEAFETLDRCLNDLNIVKATLVGLAGSPAAPYLLKYCVIRASGSIEIAFKKVIADKVDEGSHEQVRTFIRRKIRNSSKNPKLEAMEATLHEFDSRWGKRFTELVALDNRPRLKGALTALVNARNSFSHGGESDLSIDKIIEHFQDGVRAVIFIDSAVNHSYDSPPTDSENGIEEEEVSPEL